MWFFTDPQEKIISKLNRIVEDVNNLLQYGDFSLEDIKKETELFKKRLADGETVDDLLLDAFALVKEVAKRTIGLTHYDVQLLGGIVLHQGKIAEMKTGEGKTLVATLAAYLNALEGLGVHVVTVNDYLSRRDMVWMGQIFYALGLSVGCLNHEQAYLYYEDESEKYKKLDAQHDIKSNVSVMEEYLKSCTRKEAYAADITYGTNNEFGFDYLRDNLVTDKKDMVQRGQHFAIIDEVDSILIDEARTPLIISMADEESTKLYGQFAQIMPRLLENEHYNIDEKMRAVTLTEDGIVKVESILGVDNIYDTTIFGSSGIRYLHHLEQALKAQALFKKDKDYIIKNGEVIIVDEFTGRLMPGRRYSEGLHQAIEAKERVTVQRESRTLASVTFQNYFRMYKKLSGMTGTASTSAEEFSKVYKLEVLQIPSNKPNQRKDLADAIYQTESGKYKAVIDEIKQAHEAGRPILVGTVSIEKNEYLSSLLQREGIKHELLNAKNHEREAEIISQAGKFGAVTIATNMAGRGVDIILGGVLASAQEANKIRELGGLYVLGTVRHEARRIDNQLRGRSGRQGDPGASKFFISLEDDLMRVFASEKMKSMMKTLGVPEDQPIENKFISKAIESAQQKIEGFHFDSRKHVLDYDEVINKHRNVMYETRKSTLFAKDITEDALSIVNKYMERIVKTHTQDAYPQKWNMQEIEEDFNAMSPITTKIKEGITAIYDKEMSPEDKRIALSDYFIEQANMLYAQKEEELSKEVMGQVVKTVILRNIDTLWMDHLENMEHAQDSVRLRAYGQHDPLVEYKNEGHRMFQELQLALHANVAGTIFKMSKAHTAHPTQQQNISLSGGGERGSNNITPSGIAKSEKVGRNDPCTCGSGKKYKKCHGK